MKTLFILCKKPECFPEHKFTEPAKGVSQCVKIDGIGAVNWD